MGSCGGAKREEPVTTIPSTVLSTSSTVNARNKDIHVAPSQFVRELTGDFRDHYNIGKKLGGGNL